ncbi:helix-turn-helix domain-containing protein [Rhodococcus ruber]|nr:helix-turn-helix transcriptional regulator [Rhodococcus ruber]
MRGFDPARLVDARRTAGLSQAELARRANVGAATIRRWENGTASPQVDLLARVVGELSLTIADVVRVPMEERFPGDWRVLRGMTQPQLGARAGVGTAIVGSIERGEITLSANVAEKLARTLDISVEELQAAHHRARTRPAGTPA